MLLEARIIGIMHTKNYEYWFSFLLSYRRLGSGHFFLGNRVEIIPDQAGSHTSFENFWQLLMRVFLLDGCHCGSSKHQLTHGINSTIL